MVQKGHPYAIDSMHAYLMEPQYKLEEDGYFIEQDTTFSIEEFMADLERFYLAMRMQFAFEQMCLGNDEPALALHEDGRYFSGLPFLNSISMPRKTLQKLTAPRPKVIC